MDTRERIKFRIGFSRMEKQYQWKDHVIFMGLLLGLAVWLNHGIQIKGLYMDDLYFWSCYGEQSFVEYVFPMGSTRFRFLYYLAAWLEMAVELMPIFEFDEMESARVVDGVQLYNYWGYNTVSFFARSLRYGILSFNPANVPGALTPEDLSFV